ncbi:MAG: phosphomannomutase [Sulfurovum sp.]|nr:MAG: phosphomannomutase [Sulfurovum sp.]
MTITIKDEEFNAQDIRRLYSAAIIKTEEGGTKEVSLEWIDKEENANVEIIHYGIFVDLGDDDIESFYFETREEIDMALAKTTEQIRQKRNGR